MTSSVIEHERFDTGAWLAICGALVLLVLALFTFFGTEPVPEQVGFVMMTLPDREIIAVSECPFSWGPLPWVTTLSNTEVRGVQFSFVRVATYGGVIFAEAKTKDYVIPEKCGAAYQ